MAPPRRDPLSAHEVAVLREMIAERQYDEARSRFLGTTWKRGRAVVIGLAAIVVFGMQLATTVVLMTHLGGPR